MSKLSAQIEATNVGRVFSFTSIDRGTDWWLRVPRGYRWIVDWHNVRVEERDQITYPLTDEDWSEGATIRALTENESVRFLAIVALSGQLPEEYRT